MNRKITSVMLSILTITTLFTSCTLSKPSTNPSESGNNTIQESLYDENGRIDYTKVFQQTNTATLPLMKTDFDGVYYTMDTQGTVRFFRIIDGILTEQQATGVYNVSAKLSGQSIPASIYYITIDGKTNGYGLYTFSSNYNIMLYDYVFFKLCELPPSFAYGNNLLLLADTDKSRFYEEKVYSEQFYFDPETSETDGYFLSEAQRQTGMDGIKMTDYKMFTDEILNQTFDEIYFYTSRAYVADEVKYVDVYTSGGYDTNVDNIRVLWDILGMTFYRTADGIYYFNKTEDGFTLNFYDNYNDDIIKEFSGNYSTDFIRSGTSILEKASGMFYDIKSNKEYKFDYTVFGSGFVVTDYVFTDKYAAIIGESPSGGLQIGVYDITDNNVIIFNNFTNRNMEKIHITESGNLIISVCYESNYTAYQLVCDLNKF